MEPAHPEPRVGRASAAQYSAGLLGTQWRRHDFQMKSRWPDTDPGLLAACDLRATYFKALPQAPILAIRYRAWQGSDVTSLW